MNGREVNLSNLWLCAAPDDGMRLRKTIRSRTLDPPKTRREFRLVIKDFSSPPISTRTLLCFFYFLPHCSRELPADLHALAGKRRGPRETVPSSPPFFTPLVSPSTPHAPSTIHPHRPPRPLAATAGRLSVLWGPRGSTAISSSCLRLAIICWGGYSGAHTHTHAHTDMEAERRPALFSSICSSAAIVSGFSTKCNISGNYEAVFSAARVSLLHPGGPLYVQAA